MAPELKHPWIYSCFKLQITRRFTQRANFSPFVRPLKQDERGQAEKAEKGHDVGQGEHEN